MDLECSGRAPVGRLVEIMNPGRHRPRQMNWVMDLDVDGDGFVEPGETGAGLWQSLEHQVERRMLGDVDGDGVLSPREYALFVPDPGAERNEDGMTRLQEARLANLDRDGDRRVSRIEVVDDFARRVRHEALEPHPAVPFPPGRLRRRRRGDAAGTDLRHPGGR